MKTIHNLDDLRRILEVKHLFNEKEIIVDWLSLISSFLNVERDVYINVQICKIADLDLGLECNLEGKSKELYNRYFEDKELLHAFLSKLFGDDKKYFSYVQKGHPNTHEMMRFYRLVERK